MSYMIEFILWVIFTNMVSKVVIIKKLWLFYWWLLLMIINDYWSLLIITCYWWLLLMIIDDYLLLMIICYWWLLMIICYWWLLLMIIKKDCNKTNCSNIYKQVIRPFLNFLIFFYDKISQVKKAPKGTKKHNQFKIYPHKIYWFHISYQA